MEIKFFKFVILAIVAGVVLLDFGNLCRASEIPECPEKFVDDPLFRPFDTVVKGIFESLEIVRPNISSLEIPKHECITCSLTQAVANGISSALDVINERNCSAVDEIEKLQEDVVSAATNSIQNIYVTIRNLSEPYAEFGKTVNETENNVINYAATAFRCLFNEIKIVLDEICSGNQLVEFDNNALELLKADTDEAISRITDFVDQTINLSADIHISYLKLHQSDTEDDSFMFQANRIKARNAFADFFRYSYELLKNCLPKS